MDAASKARGRPRKEDADRLRPLTTNLAAGEYEALCRIARRRDLTLSELAREIIANRLFHYPQPPA